MKHRTTRLILFVSAIILAGFRGDDAGAAPAKPRLALVIGEANYRSGALPTSANDAGLVAQALAESGFNVTAYADLSAAAIRRAFASFIAAARQAGPDAEAVVYLSGYGVQFDGRNYAVPVEASFSRDADVPAQAVDLSEFFSSLDHLPLRARIGFLDLARAHRLARDAPPLASGLMADVSPSGSVEVFNTAPGTVVSPGQGDYGPFATVLAGLITTPSLNLEDMLRLLRLRVTALTGGAAVPYAEGRLEQPFAFIPSAPAAPSNQAPAPLVSFAPSAAFWEAIERDTLQDYAAFAAAYPRDFQAPRIAVMLAARREALIWARTCRTGTAQAYWTYMRRYPRGPHFMDARRLLAAIQAPLEPPPRFELDKFADVPPPRAGELDLINHPYVFLDGQDAPLPPPATTLLPPNLVTFYDRFPPLLPYDVNDLPLPFPLNSNGVFEAGRITEPGNGQGTPVFVGQGRDKEGRMFLVQEGPGHKILSRADMTGSPEASGTLSQTGSTGAVIWSATAASIHASRTFMQWDAKQKLLSTKLVQLEDDDSWTVAYSGPVDKTILVIRLNPRGMILPDKARGASRFEAKPVLPRPTVLQAMPPAAPAGPSKTKAPAAQLPSLAMPPASASAPGLAAPIATDGFSPLSGPDVKSITPVTVPEPREPEVPDTKPPLVPEPREPVIGFPGETSGPRQPEMPASPANPAPAGKGS